MAKTEEILERILAADKFAATETTVPETPAETAAPETPPARLRASQRRSRRGLFARHPARHRRAGNARSRPGSAGIDARDDGGRGDGRIYQVAGLQGRILPVRTGMPFRPP